MPDEGNSSSKISSLETALRESEEQLRLVLEGSQQGFWDWNIETGTVQRNTRWAEMLGYSPDEIEPIIDQWTNLLHPDDRDDAWRAVWDHIEGKTVSYAHEFRLRTKGGDYKWILDHARIVRRDPKGRPLRMCGIQTDITERKKIENALRESESRFRAITEGSPTGIYIFQDGIIKYVNPTLCHITGYSQDELLQNNPVVFIHPEDRKIAGEMILQRQKNSSKPFQQEFRCLHKNGNTIFIEVVGTRLELNGRPAELGNVLDVTRRKQIEIELEEDKEIFKLFMEHSPVYVFIKDEDIRPVLLSKNYEEMLGKPIDELLGKDMEELFPPEIARNMKQDDLEVLRSGKPIKVIEEMDGKVFETTKFTIIRQGKPSFIAGFTVDITERRRVEIAYQEANKRLEAHVTEIELLHEQLREQAIRDPLTGLFNRRYLQETLDREISRAGRDGQSVGLIIMDIDNFKQVNDSYGHKAGDQMLKALGKLLMANIRSEDIPCRYGGEEFVIVMPGASLQAARDRAESIRNKFDALYVHYGNQILHATMSLGVAAFPQHGLNSEATLIRADRALYHAKQKGRNCVVAYQDTGRMPLIKE